MNKDLSSDFYILAPLKVSDAISSKPGNYHITFSTDILNNGAVPDTHQIAWYSNWESGEFKLEGSSILALRQGETYHWTYTFSDMPADLSGILSCRLIGNWSANNQAGGKWQRSVKTPTTPKVTAVSGQAKTLTIPHPEELMNTTATLENTDVMMIVNKWLLDWGVPAQYWEYWKTAIDIQVYEIYPAFIINMGLTQDIPAVTWEADGRRHLAIKPKWLNPGVIAHEQAHNSYALLTPSQKEAFSAVYAPLKGTDPLIKLLYSKNAYGLTNDIEGHAEIYRYIGEQMPTQLMIYYPRLF